jgi:hypothetical protein
MTRLLFTAALAACAALAAPGTAPAAPAEKDKKLLADVSAKLLAVVDRPAGFEWGQIDIGFMKEPGKNINAFSSFTRKDGKRYPIIRVGENLMAKVVWGDGKPGSDVGAEERLAFVVGHEFGHLVKDHFKETGDKPPPLEFAFKRGQEVEADLYGLQLALKAGYEFEGAIRGMTAMKKVCQDEKLNYSSFEGLGSDHPSWDDRLAKADKDKAHLWKVAAAFENGVTFLRTEEFPTAILCFEKVVQTFPQSHEAWANLGYARLMRYLDQWDAKDLKAQGVGQVVIGAFYTRATSIKVRAKDDKLWGEAVAALRKSDELKPGQTVVLKTLGDAYLYAPTGKDVEKSSKYFAQAAAAAKSDAGIPDRARVALLIDQGTNSLAVGDPDKAAAQYEEGEKMALALAAAKKDAPKLDTLLLYNRSLILAARPDSADKLKAYEMMEKYLRTTSLRSLWWGVAYDKYAELCKAVGKEPKAKEAFRKDRPDRVRPVTGVRLKVKGRDATVTLGDDIEDVEKALGQGRASTAMPGQSILRIQYPDEGLELLAGDQVLAVTLTGPNAPAVPLYGQGVGTQKLGELKVGMAASDVEELLGDMYDPMEVSSAGVYYNFYREQGVAVRVQKGKVVAVVVVKVPARRD